MITDKIDAITHIPDSHRCELPPVPKSVKIELTGRCNFKCSFCARSDRLREQKEMDWNLFERLLIEMYKAGVEEIGLFYLGESFMDKRLVDAVRLAKTIGYRYVFLTTNGSLATHDKLLELFQAGLDSLKFSINYADEEQFSEIARVKPSMFTALISNIMKAKSIRDNVEHATGHRCGLYGSYIQYDGDQSEKMADLIGQLNPFLDEIYALPLYNQAGFVTKRELEAGMEPTAGNRGRLDNLVDGVPCWALFTEGHITWDGMLTGCCFAHTPDFDFGDLNRVSFMDAWQSDKAAELRKAHLSNQLSGTPCSGCFKE